MQANVALSPELLVLYHMASISGSVRPIDIKTSSSINSQKFVIQDRKEPIAHQYLLQRISG